jgi:predicted PurR-regulated permease PerM
MLKVIRKTFSLLSDLLIWAFYIAFPIIVGLLGEKIFLNKFSENYPITSRIIGFVLTIFLNIVIICVVVFFIKSGEKIKCYFKYFLETNKK